MKTRQAFKTARNAAFCAAVASLIAGLSACADIPAHMQVAEGNAPTNVDKDVRFRTTYYFRVFDYCYDAKKVAGAQQPVPVADSLYRFVMTGQANAFATKVRFESGTLKSAQIDPFGATIERDKNTGRMRFVPEGEVQARALRGEVADEINSLQALRQQLVQRNLDFLAAPATQDLSEQQKMDLQPVKGEIINALDKQIAAAITSNLNLGKVPPQLQVPGVNGMSSTPPAQSEVCPEGSQIKRGFQIMGPQGLRTYDQDERLIMAMSTEASGLLAALSEVSGRVLKAADNGPADSALLLALTREQLRVSELERTRLTTDDFDQLIGKLTTQLRDDANKGGY